MDTNISTKKELVIGSVRLKSVVTLAPMAGITDTVFRQLIRKLSDKTLLTTEMLSSEALKWNKEQSIAECKKEEQPIAFQLSGHKPDLMAESAKKLEERATIIDINMGCPAPKIVKNGDGSALMRTPELASEIIKSVKGAVDIPVTAKFRLGWDMPSRNYLEFAQMAQDSGADAITVHGRTKSQMYSGEADWEAIAEIKQAVDIPVIGNGDITSVEKAIECLELSKCDGIAIGRGCLGDPELISRIEHYIETGEIIDVSPVKRRIELLNWHLEREIQHRGEEFGIRFMRKFFAWYIKGVRDAAKHRDRLVRLESYSEIKAVFDEITS